eukprot:2720925-Rhodomonas_salina.2
MRRSLPAARRSPAPSTSAPDVRTPKSCHIPIRTARSRRGPQAHRGAFADADFDLACFKRLLRERHDQRRRRVQ